ncbi:MAG: hypothetical protein IIB38_13100 [Candidatus Hydrogenedentes bacterium]|nr:hypothetical protein [Candidatus Hydrogenedentota bacterium]
MNDKDFLEELVIALNDAGANIDDEDDISRIVIKDDVDVDVDNREAEVEFERIKVYYFNDGDDDEEEDDGELG